MQLTNADLIKYASRNSKLSYCDYVGCLDALYDDRYSVRQARKAVQTSHPTRFKGEEPLQPGDYFNGRLRITDKGIRYVAGQCTPLEIWLAVLDYFDKTN